MFSITRALLSLTHHPSTSSRQILSRPSPKVIYVESFARVRSLSLTAKILRHFVDRFVVQWPSALGKADKQPQQDHSLDGTSDETTHENEVCRGWLV